MLDWFWQQIIKFTTAKNVCSTGKRMPRKFGSTAIIISARFSTPEKIL
jgi:hypothetical protein